MMFKGSMIIAFRDIKRNTFYAVIKALGLSIAMACAIAIFLFIKDELSYDRYHANADRIYRMTTKRHLPSGDMHVVYTASDFGPRLVQGYPEVIDSVRVIQHRDFVVEYGETRLTTDPTYADPSVLRVFSYPLLRGDNRTALNDQANVVISRTMAERLFHDEDPIGQTVTIYGLDRGYDLKVTGIMKDIPANSHLRFELLASLDHLKARPDEQSEGPFICDTYLLLHDKKAAAGLQNKLPDFLRTNFGDRAEGRELLLQPLTSIHLGSHLLGEEGENSRVSTSLVLSLISILIILIAVINFVNLSIAGASRRSREVGLRKTIGAAKFQLIYQFLGESILFGLMAVGLAIILAMILLPLFSSILGKKLTFGMGADPLFFAGLLLLAITVGVLAGSYPAFYLSSFRPAAVLKGSPLQAAGGQAIRKGLIIVQFAVSVIFVTGTIAIQRQFQFIKTRSLGLRNENVVSIPIYKDSSLKSKARLLERELGSMAGVLETAVSYGMIGGWSGLQIQCSAEGKQAPVQMRVLPVGDGFFRFFGIGLVTGRDFRKDLVTDATTSVIINEAAARTLGWKDPLGKQISSSYFAENRDKPVPLAVIGVIRDHHNGSFHDQILPTLYQFRPEENDFLFLRLHPENISKTIAGLEKKWKELPTHIPFFLQFLDRPLENSAYDQDRRLGRIFRFASAVSLALALFGVIGMMAFFAEKRKREIGIRKVLGAGRNRIIWLLVREFTVLGLAANLLGWPIALAVIHRWLDNFAYRAELAWWIFVVSGFGILGLCMLIVGGQAARASGAHPADAIRYE